MWEQESKRESRFINQLSRPFHLNRQKEESESEESETDELESISSRIELFHIQSGCNKPRSIETTECNQYSKGLR